MGELEPQKPLLFALNGERVELFYVDPSMTLLTYLRTQTKLTGTKLGCGEGGCGACVVLLSKYDSKTKQVEDVTVNSCLALLSSVDHCAVTTIEGLGSSRSGLHAVQKRFAGFHASQCGFCTPGMCMSVFAALEQQQPNASSSLDVEKYLSGNICRCTGYRPISDVCKSFVPSHDIEDLGVNTFWRNAQEASAELLPAWDKSRDPKFPEFLVSEIEQQSMTPLQLFSAVDRKLFRPSNLQEIFSTLEAWRDRKRDIRFVVGNTSSGIYKDWDHKVLIDIKKLPQLHVVKTSSDGVEVGAAVTISKFIRILEAESRQSKEIYPAIIAHLNKLASPHVRNAGSIGGNLMLARNFEFDSDLATVLLGVGASVVILSDGGAKEAVLSMDDFLNASLDDSPFLLQSVLVPSLRGVSKALKNGRQGSTTVFKTYRASPRPSLGNAVSYGNAAFLVQLSPATLLVEDARLAFGAFGHKHAFRATEVEKFLTGKAVDYPVIAEAMSMLKKLLVPMTKRRSKSAYRVALAVSFLFKFFDTLPSKLVGNGVPRDISSKESRSLIVGRQKLAGGDKRYAVGEARGKDLAELQASGEAVYVDDIPSPKDCLHAAYVYSEKALAKIKAINLESALGAAGAVSFVGLNDIPPSGANAGVSSDLVNERLFAEDMVECVGQAIGLMVADTRANALAAAKKVSVVYDTDGLGDPILTIEDAVSRGSFYPPVMSETTGVGDVAEGFAKADHKICSAEVRAPTQYFFYMETQSVLVIPEEDNCFTVYSSSQAPEFVQQSVAKCLGIPMHNVRAITRRVGGGFGGKASKACLVASACALAARKLQRPVRMYLDRKTDMVMMGGREEVKAVYSVGFTAEGKITALEAAVYALGGWSPDMVCLIPFIVMRTMMMYNWGAFKFDMKACRSNLPSRTSVRAPGDVEGTFIADTIIEHVASALGVDPQRVYEANMHTLETAESFYGKPVVGGTEGFTLRMVWDTVKKASDFERRLLEVKQFNEGSLWTKKGIAIVPCSYVVGLLGKPGRVSILSDSSVVVEVGGVEIGQGLWTKVKQAAAFSLSKLFDEDDDEKIPISKFRVVQADSISMPNGGWTGGSTASEGSCEAVRRACAVLVERLSPIKQGLLAKGDGVTWESLVAAAKVGWVDLSAQSFYAPEANNDSYLVYGAAASEVEVDVLTGETKLLRTDLVYDCGKSMNPAVDIGQVEGAFVHGIGFFVTEEYVIDGEGRLYSDGTWTYKPPTVDNVPAVFNIELLNSPAHEKRILSSKASGEPPLLLASSVHCAIRHAIASARKDASMEPYFQFDAPATVDRVRTSCGLDNVESYVRSRMHNNATVLNVL